MRIIGELLRRLLTLMRRSAFRREFDEEMRLHRELKTRELVTGGMPEEEAPYAANRAIGNAMALSERGREAWGWRWLEDFLLDLRFGCRMLRKNPGFTATAVLTLALGVGANAAIFSVVNAVLLQPLPYSDPGRLIWADEYWPRMNDDSVPHPDYTNWNVNNHTFGGLAAYDGGNQANLTGIGEPERIETVEVTPNLLTVLGVGPSLGRNFSMEEGLPGGRLVAILGDRLWKRKFRGDPNVLGKGITLSEQSYIVIGVMPPGFRFPDRRANPELLLAFQLSPKVDWTVAQLALTRAIGRLKPGVSLQAAYADLAELSKRTTSNVPASFVHMRDDLQVQVIGLHNKLVGDVRPTLLILLASVAVVLLIACVNTANLQLARIANRQKELAVRAAIGASRTRLLRQLLTEGVLIATMGGLLGLACAVGGVRMLRSYAPSNFLQTGNVAIDRWVLLFTFGVTCLTVVLFGATPALRASRPNIDAKLKNGRDVADGGSQQDRLRSSLATSELALAVVLLAVSGLLIRSFVLLSNVDPGFDSSHLLTVIATLPENKYAEPKQREAFFEQVVSKLSGLPGVQSTALSSSLPLTNYSQIVGFALEGRPEQPSGARPWVPMEHVSPGYFKALRIPLIEGRGFDERDSKSQTRAVAAIVNKAFVQRYCPNDDALGKRIRFGPPEYPWNTIVGVVGNVRHARLDHEAEPALYVPYGGDFATSTAMLVIRTKSDPQSLASAVRDLVLEVDPEQPVFDVRTMEERIADAASGTRFNATLLGFFGFVALALAAVGVYGVIAYSVTERTHEIGIRAALGASRRDVAGMVMSQGMAMTVAGIALGLVGAAFATRFLAGLLYGIAPGDPLTLGSAAAILGVVALAACYLPARRAMKVDPMAALRHE